MNKIDQLKEKAKTIKTNELPQSNTALLVGKHLEMINEVLESILTDLKNKVSSENGKGLSTNDFTNAYKTALDTLNTELSKYVQKETGKGLSANDYTDEEKNKLSELEQKVNEMEGGADIVIMPSNHDLDIADENGNIIGYFDGGHFKTKNFDSANISASGNANVRPLLPSVILHGYDVGNWGYPNTLNYFKGGIDELGCTFVECDMVTTSDGVLVGTHYYSSYTMYDDNDNEITFSSFSQKTWDDVKDLYWTTSTNVAYPHAKIMRFEELANYLKYRGVYVQIDNGSASESYPLSEEVRKNACKSAIEYAKSIGYDNYLFLSTFSFPDLKNNIIKSVHSIADIASLKNTYYFAPILVANIPKGLTPSEIKAYKTEGLKYNVLIKEYGSNFRSGCINFIIDGCGDFVIGDRKDCFNL